MLRTIGCVYVVLATGAVCSAQYAELAAARRNDAPENLRFRFLSLAEARAIALEQSHQPELDLGCLITEQPSSVPSTRDLVRRLVGDPNADVRVLARLTPAEGIIITGVCPALPRAQLERHVNQMLLNVETAYWNLYGSYWQLHSREQGLRFAYEVWKIAGTRYRDGEANLADFVQAQGQYELFRGQRLRALDTVLDNERQLRSLLGMPIENGVRLVPSDAPTLVEKKPDWEKALRIALKDRPELGIAREDVKVAKLHLLAAEKILLPIQRFLL